MANHPSFPSIGGVSRRRVRMRDVDIPPMMNMLKLCGVALLALFLFFFPACGGGGGGGGGGSGGGGGLGYTLTYANPASGGGGATLETSSSTQTGDAFLDVYLNGLTNVWGLEFHLAYNPAVMSFMSADKSASALADANCSVSCLLLSSSDAPGDLLVVVTRAGNPATVGGVDVGGPVVRLQFSLDAAGSADLAFTAFDVKDPDGLSIPVSVSLTDTAASVD